MFNFINLLINPNIVFYLFKLTNSQKKKLLEKKYYSKLNIPIKDMQDVQF